MSIVRPLLVVGAGGFARETLAAIEAVNTVEPCFAVTGVLDDDPRLEGRRLNGVPILGPIALLAEHDDCEVVVCTGNPRDYASRRRIVARLGLTKDRFATVVHPAAALAAHTEIGVGSVVLAGTVATHGVRLGEHVALMPGVLLTHDDVVADFATLASAVCLGGGVTVGEGAYLGAGALVREGIRIGAWSQLGMGSLLLKDQPDRSLWFGRPARHVREVSVDTGPDLDQVHRTLQLSANQVKEK